jgi:hypothetical protein
MLNWFTHNSYIEIPMSQHMALYFDSRADKTVGDAVSSVGQSLTGTALSMGVGGIIGGGGPLGMAFGAAAAARGAALLQPILSKIWSIAGAIIGTATGFI